MISKERVLQIFKDAEVLLKGHFLLSSGRHSDQYMQCAKIFQYTGFSEEICKSLAEYYKNDNIDVVIGPALGAVQMTYEISRHLNCRNIFTERDKEGVMTLRRGFYINPGENVLVVEDVTTTGGSVKEVMDIVRENGGNIVGVGCVVDRSNGEINFGVKFTPVISITVESWEPEQCELCKQGIPAIKPGSKKK